MWAIFNNEKTQPVVNVMIAFLNGRGEKDYSPLRGSCSSAEGNSKPENQCTACLFLLSTQPNKSKLLTPV
jgi:hypothetical protein